MYKIYINGTPLFLVNQVEGVERMPGDEKNLVSLYSGKKKSLLNFADMLEKTARYDSVTIFSPDFEGLVRDFQSHYKLIEAAGGVVANEKEEVLFIYRLGFWDLPKGKIDPGETPLLAALREVTEETGISELKPGDFLCHTWHTYRSPKGKRILKKTHWFAMNTSQTDLTPQAEENIELAEWMSPKAFLRSGRKVYGSIVDVLKKYVGEAD